MSYTFSCRTSGPAGLLLIIIFLAFTTGGCKKEAPGHAPVIVPSNDSPVVILPDIIYTQLTPELVINGNDVNSVYDLDLNNDGTPDFSFIVRYGIFQCDSLLGKDILVQVSPLHGSEIAGTDSFPNPINPSETINSSTATWSASLIQVLVHSSKLYEVIVTPVPPNPHPPVLPHHPRQMPYSTGPVVVVNGTPCDTFNIGKWEDLHPAFVGLKLTENGRHYYGWVRLDLDFFSGLCTIYDYAYNRKPDHQILAGQTR